MTRFTLAESGSFSREENYCENLRPTFTAGGKGLEPVGTPRTVMTVSGHVSVLPDGRIVSVGADHRTLSIDGRTIGVLEADYRAAMTDGERIAIVTDAGVQWVAAGLLEPSELASVSVEIAESTVAVGLSAALSLPSKLKGSYARLSGPLAEEDKPAFASAFAQAMKSLSAQAALRGLLVQPAWVGWRIVDVDGRSIASGPLQRFGELQGESAVEFTATKDGSTFTLTGYGEMRANARGLKIKVARSQSEFWRRRARALEVVFYGDCAAVAGVTGRFTEKTGSTSTLSVTPTIVETVRGRGVIAARFDLPLEGLDTTVFVGNLGSYEEFDRDVAVDFVPTEVCYGGTLRVYALSGEPGYIGVARAADPLTLRLKTRICQGRILRLCVPVGTGGGWNYGRNHFLAFTTSGIFAVSIDSALGSLSSAPVSAEKISRRDAVVSATEAIYCATAGGKLLKLTGSRVSEVECPLPAAAVGWSSRFSELWVSDGAGNAVVLSKNNAAGARTVVSVSGFLEPGYALSAGGRLVDLNNEEYVETPVRLLARVPESAADIWRCEDLFLDTSKAVELKVAVWGDGGGGRQRLIELTVNGPVNAPLRLHYRAPLRAYRTVAISGQLAPGSRLVGLAQTAPGRKRRGG